MYSLSAWVRVFGVSLLFCAAVYWHDSCPLNCANNKKQYTKDKDALKGLLVWFIVLVWAYHMFLLSYR